MRSWEWLCGPWLPWAARVANEHELLCKCKVYERCLVFGSNVSTVTGADARAVQTKQWPQGLPCTDIMMSPHPEVLPSLPGLTTPDILLPDGGDMRYK